MRINKLISYISYIDIYLKGTQSLFAPRVGFPQFLALFAVAECFKGCPFAVGVALKPATPSAVFLSP